MPDTVSDDMVARRHWFREWLPTIAIIAVLHLVSLYSRDLSLILAAVMLAGILGFMWGAGAEKSATARRAALSEPAETA